jgi:hypothetical protein
MALIKCIECRKKISSDAEICPLCGKKALTKKERDDSEAFARGYTVALAIIAVIIYWLFFSGVDEPEVKKVKTPFENCVAERRDNLIISSSVSWRVAEDAAIYACKLLH